MINESKNEDIDFQSDCYSINYFNVGRHCGFIHLDPGYLNMKIGKVPENVLKRSVFKQIKFKREEVLIHPAEDVKKKERDWFLETTWKFFLQTIM